MKKFQTQIILSLPAAIFLVVGAFFMANVPMPEWSNYASAAAIVLFAAPSFWVVRRWLGWRDGTVFLAVLGIYAILIESSAIATGFPYGHFDYTDHLGYRILGYAPWTVAFAWTPLILGSYAVAANVSESRLGRVVLCTIILVLFDMVLDPGAVYLDFWEYQGGGWYYGVPISNFGGWLFSGLAGSIIIEMMISRFRPLLPTPIQLSVSAIFIVFFWTAFSFFAGMEEPALLGILLVFGMLMLYRRFHYSFDEMVVLVDDENTPKRTELKHIAHNGYTKLHRAFSVFLFDRSGRLLLQQRALSKQTWPGVWSNSCCGHLMLHESVPAAARRRLKYELGISGVDLKTILPDFRYTAEKDGIVENEICPVLVGVFDGRLRPNADEVESVEWIDWHEFLERATAPETDISPWAIEEALLLEKSREFQDLLSSKGVSLDRGDKGRTARS